MDRQKLVGSLIAIIFIVLVVGAGAFIYYSVDKSNRLKAINNQLNTYRNLFQNIETIGLRAYPITPDAMQNILYQRTNHTTIELYLMLINYSGLASTDYDMGLVDSIKSNYSTALRYYNSSLANNSSDETYASIGNVLFYLGAYNDSLNYFEQALRINPNNIRALYGKAVILAKSQDYSWAANYSSAVVRMNESFTDAWIVLADSDLQLQRFDEALISYNKALALDNTSPIVWFNKGIAAGALGLFNETLEAFDMVTLLSPDNFRAWYNKGYTLVNLKRYNESIEAFNKTLELNPYYVEAWNNMGSALASVDRNADALIAFNNAIQLDANNTRAWYNKGLALLNMSRTAEANAAFQKVCIIDKNFDKNLNCR